MDQILTKQIIKGIIDSELLDSYDLVGGYYGYVDDSGTISRQIQEGYRITDKPVVIISLGEQSNTTEALSDTVIFNYEMNFSFLVPADVSSDFYMNLYNYRKENTSKSFEYTDNVTGVTIDTLIKVDLPEKVTEVEDTGGVQFIEYDLTIAALLGEGITFGNDTELKVREDLTNGLTQALVELDPNTLTGRLVHDYLLTKTTPGKVYVNVDIPATSLDTTHIIVQDSGNDYTVETYAKIPNLTTKDDNSGLATISYQRRGESRATATDNGAAWGTSVSFILDTNDKFHREMIEQIRDPKLNTKKYNMKITIPTFEPHYRKVVFDSVAQSSPIGGLIGVSGSVKEIR